MTCALHVHEYAYGDVYGHVHEHHYGHVCEHACGHGHICMHGLLYT